VHFHVRDRVLSSRSAMMAKGWITCVFAKKAIEQSLITVEQQLTHSELARLVLLPGFSTRDQVSEISGRGVGMDVVASRLPISREPLSSARYLGKAVKLSCASRPSLVTQHTLLVETGKQILFAIPIHYIKEAFPAASAR